LVLLSFPHFAPIESQGAITRRYHAGNQQIVDAADEVFPLVAPDRKGGTEDNNPLRREEGDFGHDPLTGVTDVSFTRLRDLQAPIRQHRFRRRRIGLDAGNNHPPQSNVPGNLAAVHGAGGKEQLHLVELLA
jgi:hypothetical protein